MKFWESTDQLVRAADVKVGTGRKWKAQEEVDLAIGRLQHWEVSGREQDGWQASGWDTSPTSGIRHEGEEWKAMMAAEVMKVEHERLNVKSGPRASRKLAVVRRPLGQITVMV